MIDNFSSLSLDPSLVQASHTLQICTLSASVLLVYDTVLTFDQEVEAIWGGGSRAGLRVLYYVNRYFEIASCVLSPILLTGSISQQTCSIMTYTATVIQVPPYFAWAGFLGFRTYALTQRNIPFAVLAFILSAYFASPNIYSITGLTSAKLAPPLSCVPMVILPNALIATILLPTSRLTVLIAEAVAIVLTWKQTHRKARLSFNIPARPVSLAQTLYNNGMLYFIVPTMLHLTTLVIEVISLHLPIFNTAAWSILRDAIQSIIFSHFLLDLGQLTVKENDDEYSGGALTTEVSLYPSDIPSSLNFDEYTRPDLDQEFDY